jgi:hypothetical protein
MQPRMNIVNVSVGLYSSLKIFKQTPPVTLRLGWYTFSKTETLGGAKGYCEVNLN